MCSISVLNSVCSSNWSVKDSQIFQPYKWKPVLLYQHISWDFPTKNPFAKSLPLLIRVFTDIYCYHSNSQYTQVVPLSTTVPCLPCWGSYPRHCAYEESTLPLSYILSLVTLLSAEHVPTLCIWPYLSLHLTIILWKLTRVKLSRRIFTQWMLEGLVSCWESRKI